MSLQAPDAPVWIHGDVGKIRQVTLNLLSNAVKFTNDGWIRVDISTPSAASGEGRLRIAVEDSGIGVPIDQLPLLFREFTQLDSSSTRRYGGTGLGLAISKRLAEMMGGAIEVTSEPGKGSRFVLALPFRAATEIKTERGDGKPEEDHRDAFAGARILLVDDNAVNQKVAVYLLQRMGCRVDVAGNGREAVSMAKRFPYDAILMDCCMPEMDGIEATRQIRSSESPCRRTPIVALTADVLHDTRQECLNAGMDDYLAKPLRLSDLYCALRKWIPKREAGAR